MSTLKGMYDIFRVLFLCGFEVSRHAVFGGIDDSQEECLYLDSFFVKSEIA